MTHINAFYGDVAVAEAEVVAANAKLEQAKAALESHPDFVKESVVEEEPVEKEVSNKSPKKGKK